MPSSLLLPNILSLAALLGAAEKAPDTPDIAERDPPAAAACEAELLNNARQLTFEGRRAGEGYFSRDGKRMVFQSEREAGNPFFQIYVLDLETGDAQRVSPGHGKTTCGWIHPDGNKVLFASTHDDPDARRKQAEELKRRESGTERRYAWDYDERYEIYAWDRTSREYANLTNALGYDAEGSWSPDGKLIAFSSNRRAYNGQMTADEKKVFDRDPAYMNDIYVMNGDGSNVRRLTTEPGYDGGPFFAPDGRRIGWRRFSPDGATAEIRTMNADGSDPRQLTRLGVMSWAPFYHPSNRYLIFTTNRHGFANFELYLVDVDGKSAPVRVTYTKGFDGLPAFTPDGKRLAWTSNRGAGKQSQIFLADWNHERALKLLGLDAAVTTGDAVARQAAGDVAQRNTLEFAPEDLRRHVEYLCRPELAGRRTGTLGDELATAYVAAYMEKLGLQPAGDGGTWYQPFEFTAGVDLGPDNLLARGDTRYQLNQDWVPVAFAKTGPVDAAAVVFAGYGIAAPKAEGQPEYDSFVHLDVANKWALVFRNMPEKITAERRQYLARFGNLRFKTIAARDRRARGLIIVSGPNSSVKQQLVQLQFDGTLSGASLPVASVTDAVAEQWLAGSGRSLKELQEKLDGGEPQLGFELKGVSLSAKIDIQQVKRRGRNVLGVLRAGDRPAEQTIVVGAHVDHLGKGRSGASLAREDDKEEIHFGADDNASGTAAMLEIAEYLAGLKRQGQLNQRRDVLFAAWDGEELGLLGSAHFVNRYPRHEPAAKPPAGHGPLKPEGTLYPAIAANLNLDMVGRLDKKLMLHGIGSSSIWRGEVERANVPVGLPLALQEDSHLPTDSSSFVLRGVPILCAFTGLHSDYHTPRDTPERINYEGAAKTARLLGLVARSLTIREAAPDFIAQKAPPEGGRKLQIRAYLGTVPDYAESAVKGLRLAGVAKGGPASKAGILGGDVIVELAGRKVENIYDYTYAIEALKIGQPAKIVVDRQGQRLTLEITPGSRE